MKISAALPAFLLAGLLAIFASACGVATPTSIVNATPVALGSEIDRIDKLMGNVIEGSLAYNVPGSMKLNETVTIQLLVSPSLPSDEIENLISEDGLLTSAAVKVTPRMKAELVSAAPEAFVIQPLHDSPEQLISSLEPTEWKWAIQARQGGVHTLYLTVSRLVEYNETEHWPQTSYETSIDVEVTLVQRFQNWDWKWLAETIWIPLLVFMFAVPATRWVNDFWKKRQTKNKAKDGKNKPAR